MSKLVRNYSPLSGCIAVVFLFMGCPSGPTQYTLTTSVVSGHGALSPATGPQNANSVVNLTGTPDTTYRVKKWTGTDNDTLTTNANLVTMSGNKAVTVEFELIPPTQFRLTYTADVNGSISGATPQTVNDGGAGTAVTAVANTGYGFVQWSDGSTQNPRADTNVSANISVTASFAINVYTLTYAAGANGSISGTTPQAVNFSGAGTTVTAVPNTGYHFVQWSDGSTQNPRADTNVSANISVTASFAINVYMLTYAAGANGSISGTTPQAVNFSGAGTTVTAVPNTGYHFVQWSDGSTQNPRTDTNVTANISVKASFAINVYALTYAAGANGSVSGTTPQTVNYGGAVTAVTAVANAGSHFLQWSDGILTATRTDANVTANISVAASFAINTYTLTYAAGANGSVSGTTPQTVNYGGAGTAVTAVANTGSHFVQWSDGILTAARTDANITASISVTASFAMDQYALTYAAGLNGSISGTTPQTVNYGGAGTAVSAVPNTGYHFVQWSDGSTQNPRTDTSVTANISVTASFAINVYTLTYAADAFGSINGTTPQTVNYGGAGTAVSAVPNTGYHFVQWSDGSTQNPRTDTSVAVNLSVSSSFAANAYALNLSVLDGNGTVAAIEPAPYLYEEVVHLVATAAAGYSVEAWTGADVEPSTASSNTVTMTGDKVVTVSFAVNTYTLALSVPGGHGTLMALESAAYSYGEVVHLMATAAAGYSVEGWTGADVEPSTASTNTVTMTADKVVTVSFAVNTYALTYTAGTGGLIAGTNPQTVNYATDGAAVTAVPNVGYIFLQWSDGSMRNPRTDTNVMANVTVTADFDIIAMLSVPSGTFTMGNSGVGDDALYGSSDEFPTHAVTLGAYQIGAYDVTNRQYCAVLNWALAQGYLKDSTGADWAGTDDIYAGGDLQMILYYTDAYCNIQYSGGVFSSKTRAGIPGTTSYSMDTHPAVDVSWYGSVAFCDWLSQWQGLAPCYDMTTADWPLTEAPPTAGGYRLPTEAEWERAAAWDGIKHWIYGFTGDTLTDKSHANYADANPDYVNPFGLTSYPYTSPVGWFNGINISPNGDVQTMDSLSPAGCYDMSGNVWQWCQDWHDAYTADAVTDPTGSATGSGRVMRGGGWSYYGSYCRSAHRGTFYPSDADYLIGFRVVR